MKPAPYDRAQIYVDSGTVEGGCARGAAAEEVHFVFVPAISWAIRYHSALGVVDKRLPLSRRLPPAIAHEYIYEDNSKIEYIYI